METQKIVILTNQDQINTSSSPENDPEISELLKTLNQTFTSSITKKIKDAEEKLKHYDSLIINKFPKIISLFTSDNVSISNKKALSIRIKYLFISFQKSKNIDLNSLLQNIELLINTLIDCPTIKNIPPSIVEQICEALKFLLNNKLIKQNEKLLINLTQSIINKTNEKNKYIIFSFLYLIILSPNTNINNINDIVNSKLIDLIKNNVTNSTDIDLQLKIVDVLLLSLKKLLDYGQSKNLLTYIIHNLYDNLFRVILDYCPEGTSIVSFINPNLQVEQDHLLKKKKENLLKSKILLSIGFMVECDISINDCIKDNKLLVNLAQLIQILNRSFDYIIKEKLDDIKENYYEANYEIIIYQSFSLIDKCITKSPFKEDFINNAKNFIFFRIFPFLTINLGEKELFINSPDEYYLQIIDSMTDFSFKKIKTICGKTLSLICSTFQDLSFMVLNTIFELLIFSMEEIDERTLYKYPLINNEIGEFLIENYSHKSLINTSLLCMCILAKHALVNNDLKKFLHDFLLTNQMRLENIASHKIQFKLCLLYGLFIENLFDISNQKDLEFVKTAINFLLSIILYSNSLLKTDGLTHQAYHSLEQILDVDNLVGIVNEMVSNYVQQLIDIIPNPSIEIFIETLILLIEKLPVMQKNILAVTNNILKKINNDVEMFKKNEKGEIINMINKEIYLLGIIIEKFSDNELDTKICEFIVSFIKIIKNDNFNEQIMNILISFSKKKNKSSLILQLLNDSHQIILNYYKYSKNIDFPLFQILNYTILNNNICNIQNLIQNILLDSLKQIDNNFYGQKHIIFTLSLLICFLIKNDSPNENVNNIIINIIETAIEKYLNITDTINSDNNYLKYLYLVLIISSLIQYNKISFSIIFDKNLLKPLLISVNNIISNDNNGILENFFLFNKLIILGLCNILYDNENLKQIFVFIKDVFIIIYNLISKQLIEEKKIKKSKDNESDEVDNNKDYLIKKMSGIINKKLILPNLGEYDEYESFKKIYMKLCELNETKAIIEGLISEMDENAKKDFENILLVKKINITNNNSFNTNEMEDENNSNTEVVHRRLVKIKPSKK